METRVLTGPAMPDEDSAKAAMNGTIESLGKDGAFEIVSLEAREVDGVWIATLVVHILDPEPEVDDDDEGTAKGESGERQKTPAEGEDMFALLHGHLGKNDLEEASLAGAMPDFEMEVPGLIDPPHPDMEDQNGLYAPGFAMTEPDDELKDEIAEAARESVESLTQEFQEAETGDNIPADNGALDYALAAAQSLRLDELQQTGALSDEELLILAEEERRRVAMELAAARSLEELAPDPARSA